MNLIKHARLAKEATELHKAWLLAAALLGQSHFKETIDLISHFEKAIDLFLPNYLSLDDKSLKKFIAELEDHFEELGKIVVFDWQRSHLKTLVPWFAQKLDHWIRSIRSGQAIYEIGRVRDVEQAIGKLGFRRVMECPPYAQVLLQGFYGAAIRHPEYHLARDLALLYNLFLDAGELSALSKRNSNPEHCTEVDQSLGRSVILTCFNLLESFITGIATAYLMDHPSLAAETAKALREPDRRRSSLKARFEDFPTVITGQPNIMEAAKPMLDQLFGECKWRRDSFVHCEPGPQPTKWGTVKEEDFHNVGVKAVNKTVNLTLDVIHLTWKLVHHCDGPRWMPRRSDNGRFHRVPVGLSPKQVESGGGVKGPNQIRETAEAMRLAESLRGFDV